MKNNPKIGELINDVAEQDSINITIIPLVASNMLYPGNRICLKTYNKDLAKSCPSTKIKTPFWKQLI